MRPTRSFGEISLPILPEASAQKFQKLRYIQDIDDTQQCLLDNIWCASNDHQFLTALNALSIYFQNQNFQKTKGWFLSHHSNETYFNQSNEYDTNKTLVPPRCYQILLDRCTRLQEQVQLLQQSTKKKTSITPLVMAENVQPSLLDGGESVCGYFSKHLALPKTISLLPHTLPPEIVTHIHQKAQQTGQHFHQFLFHSLLQLAGQDPYNYPEILPGLSFVWDTLYNDESKLVPCPKLRPHCQEIPLERAHCECNLLYSIPRACINLATFQNFTVSYKTTQIEITPMTLLDYGFLNQIIITNPSQTHQLSRKLAICIQNIFSIPSTTICQALIQSKMPEWTSFGTIIPAQHIIHVTASQNYNPHYHPPQFCLLGCEFPTWICNNPIPNQIQNYIAHQIATHIGDNDVFTLYQHQFRLFSEDSIQKIRTIDYFGEVPFLFHTKNKDQVLSFEEYHQKQKDHFDSDYWDHLSDDNIQ